MKPILIRSLINKLSKVELISLCSALFGRPVRNYDDYLTSVVFAKNTDKDVIKYMITVMPTSGLISAHNTLLDSCDINKDGNYPPNVECFLNMRKDHLRGYDRGSLD